MLKLSFIHVVTRLVIIIIMYQIGMIIVEATLKTKIVEPACAVYRKG